MIIGPLLLMGALPDLSNSPLVKSDHQHEWVVLENDGAMSLHWDRRSIETWEFPEGEFPVILIRMQWVPKSYPSSRVDVLIAIDCTRKMTATVQASQEIFKEAYEPGEYQWTAEKLDFGEFDERDIGRKETQEMMRAVCGEEWKP